MRLVNFLADMGPTLSYGTECATAEQPATAKDFVLREAYVGRVDTIGTKPPVLLVEGMTGASCRLHEIRSDSCEAYNPAPVSLRGKKAVVLGAAIIDTRQGALPVTIMYQPNEKNLVAYVANCCLASLEAEFNDSAFDPEASSFQKAVCKDGAARFMASFREGAADNRNLSVNKMPDCFFATPGSCTARFGIIPFLSLRSPQSSKEMKLMVDALLEVAKCLPFAGKGLLEHVREKLFPPRICVVTMFDSGHAAPARATPGTEPATRDRAAEVALRPVLAPLAFLIMSAVADTAEDDAGESIAEVAFHLPPEVEGGAALSDAANKEELQLKKVRDGPLPQGDHAVNEARTLPKLMRGLHLPYEVQNIWRETGKMSSCMLHYVANALFEKDQCERAWKLLESELMGAWCITEKTAAYMFGKLVDPKHALVFVEREDDGRVVSIRMQNSEREFTRVGDEGFRRLVLSPWAKVVIADPGKLSILVTRDANYVREHIQIEEKLLALVAQPEPPAKDAEAGQILQEVKFMREEMQANAAALLAACKAAGAEKPPPESAVSISLKRSAEALARYAKRFCPA
tara:strand:- start:1536 stop:3257 length:1722 start_codon:yes stop_codon:yes gene_type:complete